MSVPDLSKTMYSLSGVQYTLLHELTNISSNVYAIQISYLSESVIDFNKCLLISETLFNINPLMRKKFLISTKLHYNNYNSMSLYALSFYCFFPFKAPQIATVSRNKSHLSTKLIVTPHNEISRSITHVKI